MVNVLVISILIIPWLFIPSNNIPEPTRLIKNVFFDVTMFGIIVMSLSQGLKFEYRNKYLAWFAGWAFLTFIFNWYYPIVMGYGYNAGTIDSMLHLILSIVATIFVCSSFERIDFIRCAKAVCVSATLVSIFCVFQGIGLDPMKHIAKYGWKEHRHIAALLDNPDSVGNYLCMLLPFFAYFNKPKYYICMAICGAALLFAQSSLSLLAAFVGLFVYLILRFSKNKAAVIGLLTLSILFAAFCFLTPSFNKSHSGFTGRITAWKMLVERMNNPLFGQGLGIVKSLNVVTGIIPTDKTQIDHWTYAHNDYLETYLCLGALGLFLLILLIIHVFKNFNYKEDNQIDFAYLGSFVSFLIIMCGSFPMEMPPIALNGLIAYWALSKK